ncbi:hypothetical protein BCR32DRAFT_266447 [Anaeromyces robustus]|uniref:SHSP domain-containing protein n=1 Tax=Anaeromyces robustus TaxID=1754192 RepID=A0A1Y1XEW8_9FUNG|nr:hypothetical protein BCR32DRAFT_266447 [Anaeromyces robustus]|eukprot:ORX84232.1 hypothetical protein BCR32DRAFT_266447 [Anaeromyces robustus]
MKQNLIKNGLTFKTLGNGGKNSVINKNIANELNDCTISSIAEYYKKKKMRLSQSNQNHSQKSEIGSKATFVTKEDEYMIIINICGISKKNIKLDLVGNYFIISCQKKKTILSGDNDNKFSYFKKSFKLPNDSEPESMQAKLYEKRLEVTIKRIIDDKISNNSKISLIENNDNVNESSIHDISKIDTKEIRNIPNKGIITDSLDYQKDNNINNNIENENIENKNIKVNHINNTKKNKPNLKRKSAFSETNILKLNFNPVKNLRKLTSDTNLFYKNNVNKILCINSTSFNNKETITSKLNKLKLSSFLPNSNTVKPKKSISEQSLIHNEDINRITSSSKNQDIHNSGWILVTKKKPYRRNSFSDKETITKNQSFQMKVKSNNNSTEDINNLNSKIHYRDPNNIYSYLYVSSENNLLSNISLKRSSMTFDKNSLRNINSSQPIINKNSSNNNLSRTSISSSRKNSNSNSNHNLTRTSISSSRKNSNSNSNHNLTRTSISSSRKNSNSNSNHNLTRTSISSSRKNSNSNSSYSISKMKSESSISSIRKNSNSNYNITESRLKSGSRSVSATNLRKPSNSIPNSKISSRKSSSNDLLISKPNVRRSLSNISEKSENKKPNHLNNNISNENEIKKSLHQMILDKLNSNNNNNNTIKKTTTRNLYGSNNNKVRPVLSKQNSTANTMSIKNKYNFCSSKKNLIPTVDRQQLILADKKLEKKESKSSIYSDKMNKLNEDKLFWDHSTNIYESMKSKILKDINESIKSFNTNKKSKKPSAIMTKPISSTSVQDKNQTQKLNKSSPSPLSSQYQNLRKQSLIPSTPKSKLSNDKPLLKIKTIPNNNNFTLKKSKIPYTPTSKATLNKIDDLITNSIYTKNRITTY